MCKEANFIKLSSVAVVFYFMELIDKPQLCKNTNPSEKNRTHGIFNCVTGQKNMSFNAI